MEEEQGITISEVLVEFERRQGQSLSSVEEYLLDNHDVIQCIKITLESQLIQFSSRVFEWLYNCVKISKGTSKKLFLFVIQFIPDVIYLYLHSTVTSQKELKMVTEALLKRIIGDTEQTPPLQVPDLSRPSIYHQTLSSVASSLTVAALSRHDQTQVTTTPPSVQRPSFISNETVTSTNRLLFLTTALISCTDNMCLVSSLMQKRFCQICTLLTVRGMNSTFIAQLEDYSTHQDCLPFSQLTALSKEKRFILNDDLLSLLLQGIRSCLCQPAHYVAKQSLQAIKLRSQYEVLPLSIQVSSTLERLTIEMNPLKLPFDPESHKTYSPRGSYGRNHSFQVFDFFCKYYLTDKTHWPSRPMTILRSFTGQILHHHFNPPSPSDPRPISLDLSCDERYLSESFAEYGNHLSVDRSREPRDTSDRSEDGVSFDSTDKGGEGGGGGEGGSRMSQYDDRALSPSQITITVNSPQRSLSPSVVSDDVELRPVATATINIDGSMTSSISPKVTPV